MDDASATIPLDDAAHLLVVDDDTRIRTLLSEYLTSNGYRITVAANAAEARRILEGMDFDLLIVDVMMPGESGLSLTAALRQIKDVPILMLTALSETENRIQGLEAGADDYLSKPFDPRELLLRINSILRRGAKPESALPEQIIFGPYTFNLTRRELRKGADPIKLTDREQVIMGMFAERPGETVARHELVGRDLDVGERTIDVQINRLRRKIESDPANPLWLQTVRGIGYRLNVE
ncbi:MAG: response regulator transcription factor [Brucellaceae bacterium]|nr:response regulator transcription factor [Brucellaceae bacterium]